MEIIISASVALLLCLSSEVIAADRSPNMLAQSDVPLLVSGQRVRVKKLARDIVAVKESLVTKGPSSLQDPDEVKAKQKRLNQFKDALARYPQVDDPDVKVARAELTALQQALGAEFNRAKQQIEKIGNAQQALATIEKNSRSYAVPAPLAIPFNEEQARHWVKAASNARTVAEHNQKQLALLAELAFLPNNRGTPQNGAPYDSNDVKRLQRNAEIMLSAVQANYKTMSTHLNNGMQQMETDVFSRWQEDPKSDKKWLFLQKDSVSEAFDVISKSRAIAQSSVYLEQALNRRPELALATLAKLDQAEKAFKQKNQVALASSRLPEPKSTDPARLDIANKILQTSKYQFGEYGSIVLTTDKIIKREKKSSELEIDDLELTLSGDLKMSGTETIWTYRWQEFKFAVPLKDSDGKWYIWWLTAKNYSSGGANTPIGQWVSGKATKGNPILKENF